MRTRRERGADCADENGSDLAGNRLAVQHVADGPRELRQTVRLRDETRRAVVQQVLHGPFLHESAGEQDLRRRVDGSDLVERAVAAETRHDHVEQDQVDLAGIVPVNGDRVLAVFREQDGIAEVLKRFDQEIPHGFLVVHDEERFRASRQCL